MKLTEFMSRFEGPVETTRDGYLVHCPGHNDHTPSLRVTVSESRKVLIKCLPGRCTNDKVMEALGLSIKDLATMEVDEFTFDTVAAGAAAPASPKDIARLAVSLDEYRTALLESEEGRTTGLPYAERRFGVTEEDAARLGLGYSAELDGHPRLVVPFYDTEGQARGYQARAIEGGAEPRWNGPKNPKGGTWAKAGFFASTADREEVLVCEGPGDALTACCVLGFDSIGVRGAGLTKADVVDEVVELLGGREAVLCGDGDPAGRQFSASMGEALTARGLKVRILNLPDGLDISSWRDQNPDKFYAEAHSAIGDAPYVTASAAALNAWDESKYSLTDLGGARFVRDYIASTGSGVKFTPEAGFLLLHNGIWRVDEHQGVRAKVQEVADVVRKLTSDAYAEANRDGASEAAKQRAKRFAAYAKHIQSTKGINSVLKELEAVSGVPASLNDFDKDPSLLAVRNGVVDLRDGSLRPHDASLLITRRVNVDYKPEATSDLWEGFLARSFEKHQDVIPFMRRSAGYGISGWTDEHVFLVHYGGGANGKSVYMDVLTEVFREHTVTTPFSTFEKKPNGGVPNDLAALKGARLVMASEGEQGAPMAESVLKRVTGHDRIAARYLRREFFEYTPVFLLQLASNHRPKFKGQDGGLWRRVVLVPWDTHIPEGERDGRLADKLARDHAEAVLAWAVRGAVEWYNTKSLGVPRSIRKLTEEYRKTSDKLSGFIPGIFVPDSTAPDIPGSVLYDAYKEWASAEGLQRNDIWRRAAFFESLEERGYKLHPLLGGGVTVSGLRRVTIGDGLAIEDAPAPEVTPAPEDKPLPAKGKAAFKPMRLGDVFNNRKEG